MTQIDHNMNRKKMRPLSTKPSRATSATAGRRVWIILIFAVILIAVGYLLWVKPEPEVVSPIIQSTTMNKQTEAAQAASTPHVITDEPDTVLTDSSFTDESASADDNKGVETRNPKAILNAPLPKTDSLAKEEIDRLEDERKRLAEQEKLAAEQLAMNKQLTDMKAEQIALLEQQIAQLEADSSTSTETQ
ncbi:hypothetical protein SAMN05660405_01311 [Psychrobacter pacificensis]|uniref:Uncharacterized protein n=2 Tax=Psychrobacter TaxID=497 RepID=A0A1G6XJ87_9GAMM|nr:hypothetical protein SAMN05660405_01311 [Psychrobacter pacificensis]